MRSRLVAVLIAALAGSLAPSAGWSASDTLGPADIDAMSSAYSKSEATFKTGFVGRAFSGSMPYISAEERAVHKGTFAVGFGIGSLYSDLHCNVSDPDTLKAIGAWQRGDAITVQGKVKDVFMVSIELQDCRFSK